MGCEVQVTNESNELQRDAEIVNQAGLHARPVMRIVDLAKTFKAALAVHNGDIRADGKSPMEMMLLAAPKGTRLKLVANGVDAHQMLDALEELIKGGFGEE